MSVGRWPGAGDGERAAPPAEARALAALPPLSLYVHLPWCVRKCPYCDFNSHEAKGEVPEREYVDALLADLAAEMPLVWGRTLSTVFIGGGTPSLFSAESLDRLLSGVRALTGLAPEVEVTLEANPGTVERGRFADYRALGINRLSIGVQSLDDRMLPALGRIHTADEARRAVAEARGAGFDDLNLDLMYALPGQDLAAALADVEGALALEPTHLSCYELTLEPNTRFAAFPPEGLPGDDARFDMQEALLGRLAGAGFERYEISAFARPGRRSTHNLNYWLFGDYLGIGAGAHAKLSFADSGEIRRRWKVRHPARYLAAAGTPDAVGGDAPIPVGDTALEFMMNALRLVDGFERALFDERTGVPLVAWRREIGTAIDDGLLESAGPRLRPTARGLDLLNALLERFVPTAADGAASPPSRRIIPIAPG